MPMGVGLTNLLTNFSIRTQAKFFHNFPNYSTPGPDHECSRPCILGSPCDRKFSLGINKIGIFSVCAPPPPGRYAPPSPLVTERHYMLNNYIKI